MKSIWLHSFLMGKSLAMTFIKRLQTVIFQTKAFLLPWFPWSKVSEEHKEGWDTNFALKFMLYFAIL
ncbi:hypothetical protein [Peribacillus simplex]|uniref:hypothetical protein n=1 Tax=Peribacillus simplex TaxID=1478 RepID=UPI002989E92C|nr:hypothetical protein [Peribacillus simplex]